MYRQYSFWKTAAEDFNGSIMSILLAIAGTSLKIKNFPEYPQHYSKEC